MSRPGKNTPATFFRPRKVMGYEIFNNVKIVRSPEQRAALRKAKRQGRLRKLRRGTYKHGRVGVRP